MKKVVLCHIAWYCMNCIVLHDIAWYRTYVIAVKHIAMYSNSIAQDLFEINVEWMQGLIQHDILIDNFQNMLTFKEIVYKIDRRKMTPANIQGNA